MLMSQSSEVIFNFIFYIKIFQATVFVLNVDLNRLLTHLGLRWHVVARFANFKQCISLRWDIIIILVSGVFDSETWYIRSMLEGEWLQWIEWQMSIVLLLTISLVFLQTPPNLALHSLGPLARQVPNLRLVRWELCAEQTNGLTHACTVIPCNYRLTRPVPAQAMYFRKLVALLGYMVRLQVGPYWTFDINSGPCS